jgi:hypothetical protein
MTKQAQVAAQNEQEKILKARQKTKAAAPPQNELGSEPSSVSPRPGNVRGQARKPGRGGSQASHQNAHDSQELSAESMQAGREAGIGHFPIVRTIPTGTGRLASVSMDAVLTVSLQLLHRDHLLTMKTRD